MAGRHPYFLTGLAAAGLALVWSGPALAGHTHDPWRALAPIGAAQGPVPAALRPVRATPPETRPGGQPSLARAPVRIPPPPAGSGCAKGVCLPLWANAGRTPALPRGGPFAGPDPLPAVVPLSGALPFLIGGIGALALVRSRQVRQKRP